MRKKRIFYTEVAYVLGILALAMGTALMVRADFGLSMVVAPAYLLHLKMSEYFSWFTFGVAEYTFQAMLLVVMCIVLRTFKPKFLFSFVAAVFYGAALDMSMVVAELIPQGGMPGRICFFLAGFALCVLGIAFLFHTYIPPEVYELFVKEIAAKTGANIHKVKLIYDYVSCFAAIVLSFLFYGLWHFEGVKAGTVIMALCNGILIGKCSAVLERFFEFKDAFKLRDKIG